MFGIVKQFWGDFLKMVKRYHTLKVNTITFQLEGYESGAF
jgi:hypothetical protein